MRHVSQLGEQSSIAHIPVVLMAGGLGQRLRPLTDNCPKPMLPLNGRPLLERTVVQLRSQGFRRFFISLNYLGHVIERHFGGGEEFGVSISYLREDKRLGTGGALALLSPDIAAPVIVMNGDLISEFFLPDLVQRHQQRGHAVTVCVREHCTHIPYGVVRSSDDLLIGIDEKPTVTHMVSAGIYCLSPVARTLIPQSRFYDMPTLLADAVDAGLKTGVMHHRALWRDIGTLRDYQEAQALFQKNGAASSPAAQVTGQSRLAASSP